MKQAFVIMTSTICQGDIIGCWTEDATGNIVPSTYDTEVDAWKEIADTMVTTLQDFIDGERSFDETDFSCTEWVVPVDVYVDHIISEEHGVVWTFEQED